MKNTEWLNRTFPPIEDNGLLPSIIERLIGTPARVDEIANGLADEMLVYKPEGKWSVKEQIGHLSDLEPLWYGRVEDFQAERAELRAADLTNQRTYAANHNATEIETLLRIFREQRQQLVQKLMHLSDGELLYSAVHPRLKKPMRVVDLAFFVAEHDDHHLVAIRSIVNYRPTNGG